MSQDFSVLLHTPTDGTDGDCTASLKNPRGIEPRRILPQPRGSQAHTCMSPQSSDCLTFIHNLKPSDPSIFFRTPHALLVKLMPYDRIGYRAVIILKSRNIIEYPLGENKGYWIDDEIPINNILIRKWQKGTQYKYDIIPIIEHEQFS